MENPALDALFFGAHPDDLELSAGGLICQMTKKGLAVGLVDLTRGERGTYGNAETRRAESLEAAKVLGVEVRETLDMGDGELENNRKNQLEITELIRKYKPRLLFVPTTFDRHPDHAAAGQILSKAYFYARLKKLESAYPAHSPELLVRYFLHDYTQASFIVDITNVFEQKMAAIKVYRSQMTERVVPEGYRPIGIANYLEDIECRARYYGSLIQAKYGEPYLLDNPPRLNDPFVFIDQP